VRHPRQAAARCGRGSRHFDTAANAATHKPCKIIALLLKIDMNVPGRTLAESPAAASAARRHSDRLSPPHRLPQGSQACRDHFGILNSNGAVVMRFSLGHEGLPWPPQ
jgi:hypothetical protein